MNVKKINCTLQWWHKHDFNVPHSAFSWSSNIRHCGVINRNADNLFFNEYTHQC